MQENQIKQKAIIIGAGIRGLATTLMRHLNFSRKIENLYFVGGSVHPGGGIPLYLLSAKIVGDLVEKK